MDILETEAQKKLLARFVENWAADHSFSARRGDELSIKQRSDHSPGIDAADFADLGHGDWLLVGDDGKSFERGEGQPKRRLQTFCKSAHHVVLVRFSRHAVSAGNLTNFYAVICARVIRNQFFESSAKARFQFRELDAGSLRKHRIFHQKKNLVER